LINSFYELNKLLQNKEWVMSKDREIQKKRILYQSWYRGCKETDRIVGHFARNHIDDLTEHELDMFDELLKEEDKLIYNCLVGISETPEDLKNNVIMQRLFEFDIAEANKPK